MNFVKSEKMEDWRYFETDLGKDNEVGEKFLVFLILLRNHIKKSRFNHSGKFALQLSSISSCNEED